MDSRRYVSTRVRCLNLATSTLTTVAGTGVQSGTGDGGPALAATLGAPNGIAVHPGTGMVYVVDVPNFKVRGFIPGGAMVLVGGGGAAVSSSTGVPVMDGAPGVGNFGSLGGCALDSTAGVLYVVDGAGGSAPLLRAVDLATGVTLTLAGSGNVGSRFDSGAALPAGLLAPLGVAVFPNGSFVVADSGLHRVQGYYVGGGGREGGGSGW